MAVVSDALVDHCFNFDRDFAVIVQGLLRIPGVILDPECAKGAVLGGEHQVLRVLLVPLDLATFLRDLGGDVVNIVAFVSVIRHRAAFDYGFHRLPKQSHLGTAHAVINVVLTVHCVANRFENIAKR